MKVFLEYTAFWLKLCSSFLLLEMLQFPGYGYDACENGVYFSGQSVHALIFLGWKDSKNGLLSSDGIDLYIVGNFGVGCHDVPEV